MRSSISNRVPLRAVAAAILLVVVCASCTNERAVEPELAGVYERVQQSWDDYSAGIELLLAGDELAGQNLLAAATTRLIVATRECARTPGCDGGLFTDAMEQLVAEQRLADARVPPVDPGGSAIEVTEEEEDEELDFDETSTTDLLVSDSLLSGVALEELIPSNARVQAALNDWLTWNRPGLMQAYDNYQFMRPFVAPVYEEAGLPEALLFGMMAKESGAKVHAYSRSGAAGPLQFMHRTAMRFGLGTVDGFDTRLDPIAATRANARYMKELMRKFDGNLELGLAAYNMGQTRLRRIRRKGGGAGYWNPELYHSLPWETRNYVPSVLAAAKLFLHPEEYGLVLPELETASASIVLEEEISLGELTICLGQTLSSDGWFRTLRNLNPRQSPGERAAAGTRLTLPAQLVPRYSEHCVGSAPLLDLARQLHEADYPEKPEVMHYTVQAGDTLASIATRHRCSLRELARMNDIRDPDYVILVGQRLTVPTRG